MAVLGQELDTYVFQQIKDRQIYVAKGYSGLDERNGNHYKYYSSRTAWIKLASGVELKFPGSKFGGGLKYPKKYVLFNGTSYKGKTLRSGLGYEKSYDTSDPDYGLVPMPGIESANIKNLNRGSLKKAIIKFKVNSKRQFEIIDELYLRLGYNMMLEWGWSHYVSGKSLKTLGSTIIETEWFNSSTGRDYEYFLDEISKKRKEYEGNYDAMFARVVNFNWSLNDDGSYDIQLHLMSHGDIIESLRAIPHGNNDKKYAAEIGDGSPSTPEDVLALFWRRNEKYVIGLGTWSSTFNTGVFYSEGPRRDYVLNTSTIRDKLTHQLYMIAFTCFSYANNLRNSNFTTVPGNYDDSNLYRGPNLFGFRLHKLTFTGVGTTNYEDEDGLIYIQTYGGFEFNGKVDGPSKREIGVSPMLGKDKNTKKKCVNAIYLFNGGLPVHHKDTFGDAKEENTIDIQTVYDAQEDINPVDPENGIAMIRLGYLLEVLQTCGIPINKNTSNPIIKVSTDRIPFYIPPSYIENKANSTVKKKFWDTNNFWSRDVTTCFNGNTMETQWMYGLDGSSSAPDNTRVTLESTGVDFYRANMINVPGTNITQIPAYDASHIYVSIPKILSFIPLPKNDLHELNIDVYGLLKNVCQEINRSYGGVNNLEPILDEETNTIKIQDSTNFPFRKEVFEYYGVDWIEPPSGFQPFQIYGYRKSGNDIVASFVRDTNLTTKVSKEIASLITIGSTAVGQSPGINATAFSKWNTGKINRFNTEYTTPPALKNKISEFFGMFDENDPDKGSILSLMGWDDHIYGSAGFETAIYYPNISNEWQSKNVNAFTNYLKVSEWFWWKDNQGGGSPVIGFLPFEFTMDMDGLSGVKIYNKIHIDLSILPHYYPNTLEFVCKGVEHVIKDDDWVTKLTTIATPKASDKDTVTPSSDPLPPAGSNVDTDTGAGGAPSSTCDESTTWDLSRPIKLEFRNLSGTQLQNAKNYLNALKNYGVTNPIAQYAMLGVAAKECHFLPQSENSYCGDTITKIINKFFGKLKYKSDGTLWDKSDPALKAYVNSIKCNEVKFWDAVYGYTFMTNYKKHTTKEYYRNQRLIDEGLPPYQPGDGAKFRGKGFVQITGKDAYYRKSKEVYGDPMILLNNPDLMNDPIEGPKISAATQLGLLRGGVSQGFTKADQWNTWNCIPESLSLTGAAQMSFNYAGRAGAIADSISSATEGAEKYMKLSYE